MKVRLIKRVEKHVRSVELERRSLLINRSGVCLPSLKKRLGPRLSGRFLEYAGNLGNLIGWFKRLKIKEHWIFTENQNPGLVYNNYKIKIKSHKPSTRPMPRVPGRKVPSSCTPT